MLVAERRGEAWGTNIIRFIEEYLGDGEEDSVSNW